MDSLKTLGEELKVARTIKGLSLREVEDITGVSNSYLSQLETDKIKKPSVHILNKLSKVYDVKLEKFLEASGIKLDFRNHEPKTMVGSLFHSQDISDEEEDLLNDYLAFLRYKNKKVDKK